MAVRNIKAIRFLDMDAKFYLGIGKGALIYIMLTMDYNGSILTCSPFEYVSSERTEQPFSIHALTMEGSLDLLQIMENEKYEVVENITK